MKTKTTRLTLAALTCAALINCAAPAFADETQFPTPEYFKRTWGDLKELPTKPFHWDKKDWLIAGGVVGASFSCFIFDGTVSRFFDTHKSQFLDEVSGATTHFGDYKMQLPIFLGTWSVGIATKSPTLQKIAGDGLEASLFAAGLITPLIVLTSGRNLPEEHEDPMKFKPFTRGRYSYPSGHTTEAFAMATVIDQNLRKHFGYWHTPIVYAFATGTAFSRVYDQKHYVSDIVLGAGIGWAVGYWVSNKPRDLDKQTVFLLPSSNGATMLVRF